MSLRRLLAGAAVALLTTAPLTGCGAHDERAGASSTSPSAVGTDTPAPEPGMPKDTTLQQPKAAETIRPEATLTTMPGASELPATGGESRVIQGFPVPPGVKVKDPGPLDDTWQFDIHSNDLAAVIAFYKRVLPQMGFTVRTDVTYTLGNEDVRWDLVFDGKVSGSMVRDPDNGVVFVVVNPPGQKAIAGEN